MVVIKSNNENSLVELPEGQRSGNIKIKYNKKMKEIIKEILTNKKVRTFSALMALVLAVFSVGEPWGS
jgi:hypothetical protein